MSGSLAKFAAMRRASSLVSSFAAERQARLVFEIEIAEQRSARCDLKAVGSAAAFHFNALNPHSPDEPLNWTALTPIQI
jgi:hypothetical protein